VRDGNVAALDAGAALAGAGGEAAEGCAPAAGAWGKAVRRAELRERRAREEMVAVAALPVYRRTFVSCPIRAATRKGALVSLRSRGLSPLCGWWTVERRWARGAGRDFFFTFSHPSEEELAANTKLRGRIGGFDNDGRSVVGTLLKDGTISWRYAAARAGERAAAAATLLFRGTLVDFTVLDGEVVEVPDATADVTDAVAAVAAAVAGRSPPSLPKACSRVVDAFVAHSGRRPTCAVPRRADGAADGAAHRASHLRVAAASLASHTPDVCLGGSAAFRAAFTHRILPALLR
jgi:hypothetical protein